MKFRSTIGGVLALVALLTCASAACAQAVYVPPSVERAPGVFVPITPSTLTFPDPTTGKARVVRPGDGLPVNSTPAYTASGVAPVTATLTSVGNTAAITPTAGRPINAKITGTATGLSARLTRSDDDGATWQPLTIGGLPWAVYTGNVFEQAWVETEAPVGHPILFRIEVTAILGGTATIKLSQ